MRYAMLLVDVHFRSASRVMFDTGLEDKYFEFDENNLNKTNETFSDKGRRKRRVKESRKSDKKRSLKNLNQSEEGGCGKTVATLHGKDESLQLFRGIGKLLYNKREEYSDEAETPDWMPVKYQRRTAQFNIESVLATAQLVSQ